jgi:haloalkane dehalogenase
MRHSTYATFPVRVAIAILGAHVESRSERPVAHVPPFIPDPRLPILFLHGNPTWSFLYRGIIIRLKKKFRCIAVDYPGFGLSARPDNYGYTPAEHAEVVGDLVRHLDLRNLTVMGQDWGGPIGLSVAADEVARIRALVMGNTWFWPIDSWQGKSFAYLMSMAPMQSQILNRNLFVDKVMPLGVKHALPDEVMHHYREAMPTPKSRIGAAEFPVQLMASSAWLAALERDVKDLLTNVPLLLTWGLHDLMFTRAFMERFRESFRNVRLQRLDAKHYIQEDAPKEIAEAIESFLESLGSAARST